MQRTGGKGQYQIHSNNISKHMIEQNWKTEKLSSVLIFYKSHFVIFIFFSKLSACFYSVLVQVKVKVKKKLVEFSTKGGGSAPDFPLRKKQTKQKTWLKTLDVAFRIILRHTSFFFNFWVGGPFSAWILVRRMCQTFKAL